MPKRTVWGRRKSTFQDEIYTIEMREDGVYVRRKYHKEAVRIPFRTLINYVRPQMELPGITFNIDEQLDPSKQEATVSTMPEGQLVHTEPEAGDTDMHERGEQPAQADEGREPGLDTFIGPRVPEGWVAPAESAGPANDQFQATD